MRSKLTVNKLEQRHLFFTWTMPIVLLSLEVLIVIVEYCNKHHTISHSYQIKCLPLKSTAPENVALVRNLTIISSIEFKRLISPNFEKMRFFFHFLHLWLIFFLSCKRKRKKRKLLKVQSVFLCVIVNCKKSSY